MKTQPVRGTRDFYPEQMAVRNWLTDIWRAVSLRHGFAEYDGPIFEYLDLYTAKSGQEIVEQLFHLTDRGGRQLAIRPEMTPTLARMINARAASLPRPIKWFSVSRLCRGERPQRGRLREFFQWNLDVVGTEELLADAECILASVDCLRRLGLTAQDVVVKVNDRRFVAAVLKQLGLSAEHHEAAFAALDKATRLELPALDELWTRSVGSRVPFQQIEPLLQLRTRQALRAADWPLLKQSDVARQLDELDRLFGLLDRFGVSDFCDFDARVVRGLAYYTGTVYEAFDRGESLRAILGGGRYDNLLAVLGGPALSGTGMGMGDVVILELLEQLGRLPQAGQQLDIYLVDAEPELFDDLLSLAARLRQQGVRCDFSYKRLPIGKQLAAASARGATRCVILGAETRQRRAVAVKDLATGRQKEILLEDIVRDPLQPLD